MLTALLAAQGMAGVAMSQTALVCEAFPRSSGITDAHLVTAPDGAIWYTDTTNNRLMRVGPDRSITSHIAVNEGSARLSGLALGPDGNLWYSKDNANRIGRFPLGTGTGSEFDLPPSNGFPKDIVAGPDRNLWFHDPVRHKLGRISVDGVVTMLDPPPLGGRPFMSRGLAVGADQKIWVTVLGHNAVYRVDPETSAFTRFDIPTANSQPKDIVAGGDGNLWFLMPAINRLGRITPAGVMSEFELGDSPSRLLAGKNRDLWISFTGRNLLGRFDLGTGQTEKFRCGAKPGAMTLSADGKVWVLGDAAMLVVSNRGSAGPANAEEATGRAMPAASTGSSPVPLVTSRSGAPSATASTMAPAVDIINMTQLADRLKAPDKAGRVLVQFSSNDRGCGYCVSGNQGFLNLVSRYAGNTRVKFLRVMFEPWRSVGDSIGAREWGINGLPTVFAFQDGKLINKQEGTASAETLEANLLRDIPAR